jgi:hypothetical protein
MIAYASLFLSADGKFNIRFSAQYRNFSFGGIGYQDRKNDDNKEKGFLPATKQSSSSRCMFTNLYNYQLSSFLGCKRKVLKSGNIYISQIILPLVLLSHLHVSNDYRSLTFE